jgi:hypothetical protein
MTTSLNLSRWEMTKDSSSVVWGVLVISFTHAHSRTASAYISASIQASNTSIKLDQIGETSSAEDLILLTANWRTPTASCIAYTLAP